MENKPSLDIFSSMIKKEGLKSLFRGVSMNLLLYSPGNFIIFGGYETYKRYMNINKPE